jgi:hypothetical protein
LKILVIGGLIGGINAVKKIPGKPADDDELLDAVDPTDDLDNL